MEEVGAENGRIVDPTGFLQIGDALADVDAVLAEEKAGVVVAGGETTYKAGITSAKTVIDAGGRD